MATASNAVGQPCLPIGKAFVSAVLELLVAGAGRLQAKQTVTSRMREDSISQRLNEEMEILHRGSESDIVTWEMRPARTVPGDPDRVFEVDFSFHANILPRDRRRYLAVEAKRLKGTGDSLAGDYVRKGVMRFVTGYYARGHNYAVMIGYVVVAPMNHALASLQSAMNRRAKKTNKQVPLALHGNMCSHPHTYSSTHLQDNSVETFTLVHLLLDFC